MLENNNELQAEQQQEAWVVFSGETDLPWLKLLKPGFRHCFVLLNDGQRWTSVDPLSPYTEVLVYHHVSPSFDLPSWLEGRGHNVCKASINRDQKRAAPIMMFTCVEAIKRLLGIHRRFVLTPWQLYQCLKNKEGKQPHDSQYTSQITKGELQWVA